MTTAKHIADRWYGKVIGIALIAFGIGFTSVPAPTGALHGLEDKAMHRLAPMMGKSEIGKQILAIYVERDAQCHSAI